MQHHPADTLSDFCIRQLIHFVSWDHADKIIVNICPFEREVFGYLLIIFRYDNNNRDICFFGDLKKSRMKR